MKTSYVRALTGICEWQRKYDIPLTPETQVALAVVMGELGDKAEKRGAKKERKRLDYIKPMPVVCDDTDHYRSQGKPYDIELTRDSAIVTARVWNIPEKMRGTDEIAKDGHYRILSSGGPEIGRYTLFLWGDIKQSDLRKESRTFPTAATARDYFTHITALIDRLNVEYKPVLPFDVDLKCPVQTICGRLPETITDDEWDSIRAVLNLGASIDKPVPPFDAEEVRRLIREFELSAYYWGLDIGNGDQPVFEKGLHRTAKNRDALLFALGIPK